MKIIKVVVPGMGSIQVRNKTVEEVWDAITEIFSVKDFGWDKTKRGAPKKPKPTIPQGTAGVTEQG